MTIYKYEYINLHIYIYIYITLVFVFLDWSILGGLSWGDTKARRRCEHWTCHCRSRRWCNCRSRPWWHTRAAWWKRRSHTRLRRRGRGGRSSTTEGCSPTHRHERDSDAKPPTFGGQPLILGAKRSAVPVILWAK